MTHRLLARASMAALGCLSVVLSGCGGSNGAPPTSGALPNLPPATAGKYFTHIIIIVQENRTYDNLFATYPGGDGTTVGKAHDGSTIPLAEANLENHIAPNNGYQYWLRDWNNGRMNGFDQVDIGPVSGRYVYQYVDPAQIAPYWSLAKQYVLSDHMFQTQGTGSFTAHQDLIAGGAMLDDAHSFIDFPSSDAVWGCDDTPGSKTTLITANNDYLYLQGPSPCLTHQTLRDTLDPAGISWRYYAPEVGKSFGGDLWNAFDAVKAVRYGPEWNTNVTWPETNFFKDVSAGKLPSVSWVIPQYQNSDHPGAASDTGPSWVAQVVNAVGNSPDWKTTAIVVTWDDWGGWYDHVRPPGHQSYGGLGFRLPMLVISPFARKGYVTHNQYEFGTIVKFVEDNWGLPRLGNTDVRAASMIDDVFDFKQTARPFQTIQAQYSKEFFLHQKPGTRTIESDD